MSEITEVTLTQYQLDGQLFDTREEAEAYLMSCKYQNAIEVLREEVHHSKILNAEVRVNAALFTQREFSQLRNIQEKIERFLKVVQNDKET